MSHLCRLMKLIHTLINNSTFVAMNGTQKILAKLTAHLKHITDRMTRDMCKMNWWKYQLKKQKSGFHLWATNYVHNTTYHKSNMVSQYGVTNNCDKIVCWVTLAKISQILKLWWQTCMQLPPQLILHWDDLSWRIIKDS